ncbi:MAG: hypothetical protein OYL97_03975 [Candidatus Poribacteria bacterium]|nr:hypothetical protein [Candidatus Poribacteria bacterium]MDE0466189.1 hypothetical protein [Candidatus Poribacteria bacterium]
MIAYETHGGFLTLARATLLSRHVTVKQLNSKRIRGTVLVIIQDGNATGMVQRKNIALEKQIVGGKQPNPQRNQFVQIVVCRTLKMFRHVEKEKNPNLLLVLQGVDTDWAEASSFFLQGSLPDRSTKEFK